MKNEYLGAIKAAGFQKVRVVDETSFPVKYMVNDPTAKRILDDLKMPVREVEEIADSVVSAKVYAVKPG